MLLRRLASRFALALLLVFTQQQAVLHLLGHSLEEVASKKAAGGPAEQACEKCLAFAHLDHAAVPQLPALSQPALAAIAPLARLAAGHDGRFHAAYLSRAPPRTT